MRHIGLLKSKNILIEPASNSVLRDDIRYNVNRGAFGVLSDNSVDISWASTRNDSIFSWSFPFLNRPAPSTLIKVSELDLFTKLFLAIVIVII